MIYRIISDISKNDGGKASFCVKIVNGIILTYRGTFHRRGHDTSNFEIQASYIGLCLIEDYLSQGDTVFIHSDVDFEPLMRKARNEELYAKILFMRRRGVSINIQAIDKHQKHLYDQCHWGARKRNKAA
jgi:hypothetical protein